MQVRLAIDSWCHIAAFCRRCKLRMLAAVPPPEPGARPSVAEAAPDFEAALPRLARARVALVLGSEGQGLSAEALEDCARVSIPMSSGMESLNVATAGAIFMAVLSDAHACMLQSVDAATVDRVEAAC